MWPPLKPTFPKRAWQATLAGTADDPGGARGRRETADDALQKTGGDGRAYRRWGGERPASDPGGAGERPGGDRRSGTREKSLAGDPGGDGGRPWRGATLALQDVAPIKNHMARCGPH